MSNLSMKIATSVAVIGGIVAGAVSASAALNLPTSSCAYTFSTNMKLGSRGTDVMNLQKVLNMYPQTMVSESGAGSQGMETSSFGPATKRAVNKFQALHLAELGLTAPTGNVFAGTRGLLNQVCTTGSAPVSTGGGTVIVPGTGTGNAGPVSAMVSSNQPSSFLISGTSAGQAAGRIADFTLSGTAVVKSVKLMRMGLSDDTTLTNVYLYEGMTRIAGPSSVSKDGTVMFNSSNGLFAVTGTKNITVRGDVAANKSGSTIGFALAGIDAGAGMTSFANVNGPTLQIGSVTLAGVDLTYVATVLPAAQSLNAGSVSQNVWERQMNVSSRSVTLRRAQFKMIGSAPASSISNVTLNIDGMTAANGTVDSNGYIAFVPTNGYSLATGNHTVKVFADIVGGSDRSFYVSLENAADVLLEDSQVAGAYVMYTVATLTTGTSNLLGGTVSVQGGSVVITQDTSINNVTTLVGGATSQTLAKWKVTAYGEDVKITTLSFTPSIVGTTTVAATTLVNVGMYVDGAQVRSNQTATNASTLTYSDLGTNLVIPTGRVVTVELRGDLVSSANAAYTAGAIQFNMASGSSNAQGMYSQKVSSTASSNGQSKTIGSSNVNFAVAAGSANRSVSPNSSSVKIGSFTLQTGSSEGVNLTSFAATVPTSLLAASKLTNLTLKDGSTILGSIIGLPTSGDNTFSANVNVPVSTTKTFDLYADIGGGAAGLSVTPTLKAYYTGLESRQSSSTAVTAGITTTANVGTMIASGVTFVPASSPVAQFVLGNSNLMIAKYNIKSNNGVAGATLKDLVFTVPANTVSKISVAAGGVTKEASVVGTTATIYDAGIAIPSDASGVDLLATASLVCVDSTGGCAGVSSSTVTVTLSSVSYHDGETVQAATTTSAVTPSHVLVASKPTVVMAASTATGFGNGIVKIGEFTVSADAAGDISLKAVPITVATSGAATIGLSAVGLYDSTGNTVITGSNTLTGSGTFTLSTARKISKGTSETYTVYGTFTGVSGAAGTQSVSFGLGTKNTFLWDDVKGAVTSISGNQLSSYPNSTQTKTN